MNFRIKLGCTGALMLLIGMARRSPAQQDRPVQRIATIVSVAVEEYGKAVDEKSHLISNDEYQEALGFLTDARGVASRLPTGTDAAKALLDSITAGMKAKMPPSS